MRVFFTMLVPILVLGCSSAKQSSVSREEWRRNLKSLAAEAVQTEADFWQDAERSRALREYVLANPPHARSGGIYSWGLGDCLVEMDLLDQIGYLPGGERGKPGRLGIRVVTLMCPVEDGCTRFLEIYVGRKEYSKICRSGKYLKEQTVRGRTVLDNEQ